MLVGQALGLDVPGVVEESFHEAFTAAEGGDRLTDRGVEGVTDLGLVADHLEASPTAAIGRLDRDRQPVLLGEGDHLVGVGDRFLGARYQRGTDPVGDVAGLDLVPEGIDGLRRRADPGQSGIDHRLGEVGVLGQEAITGVDRVGTGLLGGLDDLADVEVGVGRGGATEGVRLAGEPDEERIGVRFGVHRDAAQAGVAGGADDADGDLTAVGDEHLADGHCFSFESAAAGV